MGFGLSTFSLSTLLQWVLVGFAIGIFLKDLRRKKISTNINIKATTFIAISVSIILLFLLFEGYGTTILALLGIGSGIITQLVFSYFLRMFFSFTAHKEKKATIPAKSRISSVAQGK